MKKTVFVFLLFVLFPLFVFSQTRDITGKVVDESGAGMPGVSVILKGTTQGTTTNVDGNFSLRDVPVGSILEFSFIGMKKESVEVTSTTTAITVTLETEVTELEEMVVVGYGTQKKESVVGSIGTADGDDIRTQGNVSNLSDALEGVIPGLSLLSVSGMPGADATVDGHVASELLVRGKTTWNNSSPLILVDGVERDMNDIDINEVESISVLKDASATAVFGVKGGNGVILITTKRGIKGKPTFNVQAEMSFETPSKIIEPLEIPEGAIARNYALERTRRFSSGLWNELYFDDQEIEYFRTGQYPYAYQNINWLDVMLKDFEKSYRFNISTRGGSDRVKYFASAAYNHVGDLFNIQDLGQGYVPNYSFDRLNIRSNFDFKISKFTKVRANFSGVHGVRRTHRVGFHGTFNALRYTSGEAPILQYEDGMYGADNVRFKSMNPVYESHFRGMTTEPRTTVNMDYTLIQELDFVTKGLSFSGKLAYDNTFRNDGRGIVDAGQTQKTINKEFYLQGGYYDYETETYMLNGEPANMDDWTFYDEPDPGPAGFGWVKEPNTYETEYVSVGNASRSLYYELKLDYVRSFSEHNVTGMAIFSRLESERGSQWPRKREDWVGRITYDYAQRYFIEVNGAYNGSEKFGPGYRFDFFPSVAGGWLLSEESLIKNNVDWLDKFKVRYSYGLIGNDNVAAPRWPYLTMWDTYGFTRLDGAYYGYPSPYKQYTRYDEGDPGNPDLRWETSTKQNFGAEIATLKNKISLTVDLFKEERTDMLLGAGARQNTVPPIFGKTPPPANVGEAKSHGAEFEITYRNSVNNQFNYWTSAYWTMSRSEVVYKESPELMPDHQKPEGKPVDQTLTGISVGFIESWDDLYAATGGADAASNAYLLPGDMIMLDFNSDGKYNANDDRVPYGYPTYPQNSYGFSAGGDYKGFQLSIRFTGGYNTTRKISTRLFYTDNLYVPQFLTENTWTPEYNNAEPAFPAFALDSKNYNPIGHFDQYDGSYLRLQSAQLAYWLPKRWTDPLRINEVKLYVNGRNLFLWTKMPNDGVGIDDPGKYYPTRKQVNIGLNIRF